MAGKESLPTKPGWTGSITVAATALGAMIAVGQSSVQLLKGWGDTRTAEVKGAYDLKVQDIKDRSALAETYLDRLLKKDVDNPDKMMLLGALSTLDGHPLQKWAETRKKQLEAEYSEQLAARIDRVQRLSDADPADAAQVMLLTRIGAAKSRLHAARDNPGESQKIEDEVISLIREFAQSAGSRGLRISIKNSLSIDQSADLSKTSKTIETAKKLTVDLIVGAIPNTPEENIKRFAPFIIAALNEFQITDPKLIAYAIATIDVESLKFTPTTEMGSQSLLESLYGGKIGNTEPGDAYRFRGRGFVQVTGRANYLRMSQKLGLGDLLVENPDLANDPGVASRILCILLSEKMPSLKSALDSGDLARARRIISGGSLGLAKFTVTYKKIISMIES